MMQRGLPRGIKVPGRSRQIIRRISDRVRSLLNLRDPYIDLIRLVEHRLYEEGLILHIAEAEELGEDEARAFPDIDEIHIREDVYAALRSGERRARFTVAHEIGHWILHPDVALARNARDGRHDFFEDSEWQADCFAAEFLMPAQMVIKWCSTANAVSEEFGVSLDAAIIRVQVLRSEGLLRRG